MPLAQGVGYAIVGIQDSVLASRTDGIQSCVFGLEFTERKAK